MIIFKLPTNVLSRKRDSEIPFPTRLFTIHFSQDLETEPQSTKQNMLLFAYGTLQTHFTEHRIHCPKILNIRSATTLGKLWKLQEGYPLLEIPSEHWLQLATENTLQEEEERLNLAKDFQNPDLNLPESWQPIEGQILELEHSNRSFEKPDKWECFTPGQKSVYQRYVIPCKTNTGELFPCWSYIGRKIPAKAEKQKSVRWLNQ